LGGGVKALHDEIFCPCVSVAGTSHGYKAGDGLCKSEVTKTILVFAVVHQPLFTTFSQSLLVVDKGQLERLYEEF
jgi:hypothetical protein